MFQEKNITSEGFDSTWKNEIEVQDASTETTDFSVRNQQTATKMLTTAQVQTESVQGTSSANNPDNTDMNKLAEWLKSIFPMVQRKLDDQSLTRAMKSVNFLDDSSNVSSNMLQEVKLSLDNMKEDVFVSGLSWNSTGNTVAVSCSYKHNSWCSHEGMIHLLTFDRNDKLEVSSGKKLVCGSCVTTVAFHPTEPSILCAGTISGEILIWNCQNDTGDGLVASFSKHDDKITSLYWVSNTDFKKESIVLVTTSLDSRLMLWETDVQVSTVKLKQIFKIDRSTHVSKIADIYTKKTDKGIVDVDFSQNVSGLFILGIEGGLILKCSLLGARPISNESSSVPVLDPSISTYEKHEGEIICIQFSPHRKDLFLTYASDGEIRIYHTEQATPLQTIFVEIQLNSVEWIPYVDQLLVGCAEDGSIKIFSLLNGQQIPNITAADNLSLTTIAINKNRINIVAFGNIKGDIQLWNIPWNNIAKQDSYNVFKQ